MKFYGKITVYRYEDTWNPETIEIFKDYFEAKSIQAAKAHLTRIANGQTLFSWVQSWDNETGNTLAKTCAGNPGSTLATTSRTMAPRLPGAHGCRNGNLGRPSIQTDTESTGNPLNIEWTSPCIGGSKK